MPDLGEYAGIPLTKHEGAPQKTQKELPGLLGTALAH
jgi:hypothetical protein